MASLLDSEAQFLQRASDFRISESTLRRLKTSGLTTFGVLAYAHGQPGQQINDESFEAWVVAKIDPSASIADISSLKRLLFESQTLMLASLKDQISSQDSLAVKRVPNIERESRMAHIKGRLVGLLIEGPLEPSHSLLDLCANMATRNEIAYIAPEKSVSRTHEVLHQKAPLKQIEVSAEALIVKENSSVPDGPVQSALQVQEALQRRGIGLVFADLIEHERYSRYLTTLFSHLHREPPAGYSRCTVSQLVMADKLVWQSLLEEGVKPKRDPTGQLALNTKLVEALTSYHVSFSLLPLAGKKEPLKDKKDKKKAKRDRSRSRGDKPGKGKGKGKGKVPQLITKLGGVGKNPEGENICFSFNISNCNDANPGGKCKRGHHICAKCFSNHSIRDHDKH